MPRLDTSKHLLAGILGALPAHLAALRANKLINSQPVRVRMWNFSSATIKLADVTFTADSDGATVVSQLQVTNSRARSHSPVAPRQPPSGMQVLTAALCVRFTGSARKTPAGRRHELRFVVCRAAGLREHLTHVAALRVAGHGWRRHLSRAILWRD